jgi:XFP-like protein
VPSSWTLGIRSRKLLTWVHLNRLIKKLDLNVLYVSRPDHGALAMLANSNLEGYYSEIKSEIIESVQYAHAAGIDRDEIRNWTGRIISFMHTSRISDLQSGSFGT